MPSLDNMKPRLRPVEAFPVEQAGRQWIALVDPSGVTTAQVALTPPAFFIISHFDGQHSLADVQAAFVHRFGQVVPMEQIVGLIRQLDEALLLDSAHFAAKLKVQVDSYVASEVRALRRESLPPDDVLLPMVDEIVRPGKVGESADGRKHLAGLIAPHLDYPRGLPCYTTAYGTLAAQVLAGRSPELVVILGTNHYGMKPGPVVTDKDFETPYGRVAADREAVRQMNDLYKGNLLEGQYDHVREHSVELQVTLLARLMGSDRFRIVSVILPDACEPASQSQLDRLAVALSSMAAQRNGSMLIVAGADLSHVGPRFGDERPLEDSWLKHIADSDREMVKLLQAAQPEGFVDALRDSSNITRICSSGNLYVLRHALRQATWQDLGYHQASDAESGTCVTCIAAALWR